MSWLITPQEKTPLDQDYRNVSLLLHGNGANGSTTITDSSPTPKAATLVGDVQISTAQSKFGGSSIVFDKVADRITYAASSDFAFGTGDFTIEAWVYSRDTSIAARGWFQVSTTTGGLQPGYNSGIAIFQGNNKNAGSAANGICVAIDGNNFFGSEVGAAVLAENQWQHIAVTRFGSTCRVFVNGTEIGSRTSSANLTATNLVVGGYYDTPYLFDGYIDDLRITKGVARYTANFTPPAAPFPDAGPAQ